MVENALDDFYASIFYDGKIVACPQCKGIGKEYLHCQECYNDICSYCKGKGRVKIVFQPLKEE